MLDHLVPPPEGLSFPAGAEVRVIEAADGIRLRTVFLRPERTGRDRKGTVFVLQGRAEFLEKYAEVFTSLLARGFAVAALDWRGQGGSERQLRNPRKGHVEDFDDYLLDLDALIAAAATAAMPEPYGILAHSTGACIALLALGKGEGRFRRAVMTSPLVAVAGLPAPLAARMTARLLSSIGLSGFFLPTGSTSSISEKPFEGNVLTSDPARYARGAKWLAAAPELAIGDPTIGWIDACFDALAGFDDEDFGKASRTPVLMLLAGDDKVVETPAAEALAQRLRNAHALILRGARHEILMESDAILAGFWAAFDAFMRLDAEAPSVEVPEAEAPKTGPA